LDPSPAAEPVVPSFDDYDALLHRLARPALRL